MLTVQFINNELLRTSWNWLSILSFALSLYSVAVNFFNLNELLLNDDIEAYYKTIDVLEKRSGTGKKAFFSKIKFDENLEVSGFKQLDKLSLVRDESIAKIKKLVINVSEFKKAKDDIAESLKFVLSRLTKTCQKIIIDIRYKIKYFNF